jgi:c-di-GMP-binding flagellar brake protein YcgR
VVAVPLAVGPARLPCRLDFGPLGRLEAALEVVRHQVAGDGAETTHRFGCTFREIDGRTRQRLQQVVFALELAGRN